MAAGVLLFVAVNFACLAVSGNLVREKLKVDCFNYRKSHLITHRAVGPGKFSIS